jgi:flagellar protein FlaF
MQMVAQEMDVNVMDDLAGRELEAAVLNKAAELLDNALKYNQTLWSVFQAELMDEANPLPVELRRNILSLSTFVDRRTFEVLAYPEPTKLDILIKINRSLADGLMAH